MKLRGLLVKKLCCIAVAGLIASCGGGGGGEGLAGTPITSPGSPASSEDGWVQNVFAASANFDALCESPRAGTDSDGNRYPDRQGAALDEKLWLRSWTDELYLWYNEVTDRNPDNFATAQGYFDQLKTTADTPSGRPKDNFHSAFDTAEYQQLSQSGTRSGYGLKFAIENTNPRSIFVAYVEPGSPAADASITRGTEIIEVNSFSVSTNTQDGVNALNAGLFPSEEGERHDFTIRSRRSENSREISLESATVMSIPVTNVTTAVVDGKTVGYFLFNDHIATAEDGLVLAIETLAEADVDELVMDLRYNGGGFLAVASQLSYMIAGPSATNGRVFEQLLFNDKHPTTNPVTGNQLQPIGFIGETIGLSRTAGDALPSLGLSRVFVLTSGGTCSASEAIINGLRGIDVDVVQIGESTCGKPYGFYPADNCGTTYLSIQFQGANDKDFGEYPDGFSPQNSVDGFGVKVPGCEIADDLSRDLGDPLEARFATALHYIESGRCPTVSSKPSSELFSLKAQPNAKLELIGKHPALQNRILEGLPQ